MAQEVQQGTLSVGLSCIPFPAALLFWRLQAASLEAADLTSRLELIKRFRGLMARPADSSLILKPLALLSRRYDEDNPDLHDLGMDQTEVSLVLPDLISALLSLHTALKCAWCIAASGCTYFSPHV